MFKMYKKTYFVFGYFVNVNIVLLVSDCEEPAAGAHSQEMDAYIYVCNNNITHN